jgi:hypothetical protein
MLLRELRDAAAQISGDRLTARGKRTSKII